MLAAISIMLKTRKNRQIEGRSALLEGKQTFTIFSAFFISEYFTAKLLSKTCLDTRNLVTI